MVRNRHCVSIKDDNFAAYLLLAVSFNNYSQKSGKAQVSFFFDIANILVSIQKGNDRNWGILFIHV